MSCSAKGLLVCFLFGCVCFYRFYRYNNLTQDSVQLFILYFVAAKFVLWYSTYKQTAFVSLGFGLSTSPRTDSTLLQFLPRKPWQIFPRFSPIIYRANATDTTHLLLTAQPNVLFSRLLFLPEFLDFAKFKLTLHLLEFLLQTHLVEQLLFLHNHQF